MDDLRVLAAIRLRLSASAGSTLPDDRLMLLTTFTRHDFNSSRHNEAADGAEAI